MSARGWREREREAGKHRARLLGSSMAHISPRPVCQVVIYEGAGLVCVSPIAGSMYRSRGGGVRGAIQGFSRESRCRMLRILAKVRRDALQEAVFITLTYPGRWWPGSPSAWKRDLDSLLKRIARRYPQASAMWRMEAQERGAPHFHLLVFGAGFIPHEWTARVWWEVVGSGDLSHLRAGTETRGIVSPHQAVYYVAKYAAKADDGRDYLDGPGGVPVVMTGRQWGVWHRRLMPFGDAVCLEVGGTAIREGLQRWLADETGYRKLADRTALQRVFAFCSVASTQVRDVLTVLRAETGDLWDAAVDPLLDAFKVIEYGGNRYFSPLRPSSKQLRLCQVKAESPRRRSRKKEGRQWQKEEWQKEVRSMGWGLAPSCS